MDNEEEITVQNYDMSANYSGYTRILLVDEEFEDSVFTNNVNPKTYSLVYTRADDPVKLKNFVTTKFPFVRRIGIVCHGPNDPAKLFRVPDFVGLEQFFKDSDLAANATTYSSRVQLIRDLVKSMSINRIDFLGCNLLRIPKWKTFFNVLKKGYPNLVVGASNDNTGNLKYGGNWTMENTGQSIKTEYFTSGIATYTGLLSTYTADAHGFTWQFNKFGGSANQWRVTAMYQLGTTTNAVTGGANGNPVDVIIPETLNDGTTDRVIEIDLVSPKNIGRSFNIVKFPSGYRGSVHNGVAALGGVAHHVSHSKWGAQTLDFSLCSNLIGLMYNICRSATTVVTVKLHPNIKDLGSNAFNKCFALTTIDFGTGASNVEIGTACFYSCSNLVLNDFTVFSSFGNNCFQDCTSLPSALTPSMLPTSLTAVGTTPFNGCTQITSIDMSLIDMSGVAVNSWGAPNATYTLPNNMNILGNLYSGNTTIVNLVLPTTVTSLAGTQNFKDCTSLISVDIPSTVTSMGFEIFRNCTSLTSFTVPTSVTSIGKRSFQSCSSLSSLVLHDGITEMVNDNMFTGCTSLTSITLPAGITGYYSSLPPNLTYLHTGGATSIKANQLLNLETVYVASNSLTSLQLIQTTRDSLRNISVPSTLTAISASDFNLRSETYSNIKVTIRNEAAEEEYKWSGAITDATSLANAINGFTNNQALFTSSTKKISSIAAITTSADGTAGYDGFAQGISKTDPDIVGTTDAEKRDYTHSEMKKLRQKWRAEVRNTFIESNGITRPVFFELRNAGALPGLFQGRTYSVVKVFDANTAIDAASATVGSAVYAPLESNEYVDIPESDAVDAPVHRVTKTGDTSYTKQLLPDGAITTHAKGDEFTYGRMTVSLGGAGAEWLPDPAKHFVLTAFDSQFTLTDSALVAEKSLTVSGDATITLSNTIPKDVLRNTFFYRTDDVILDDASFVYHFVDTAAFTNGLTALNPKNGTILTTGDGAYIAGDNISKDYLRDLAKQLFGTTLGVDLFTNEDAVVTNMNSKCDTVATDIFTKLTDVNLTSATFTDASLNNYKYLKDDTASTNICRELLTQMYGTAPERFQDITTNAYTGNGNTIDGYFEIPFESGDVISYKVTVQAPADQLTKVTTGRTTSIVQRTYQVNLNVGA